MNSVQQQRNIKRNNQSTQKEDISPSDVIVNIVFKHTYLRWVDEFQTKCVCFLCACLHRNAKKKLTFSVGKLTCMEYEIGFCRIKI